jgi:hypothetical protein
MRRLDGGVSSELQVFSFNFSVFFACAAPPGLVVFLGAPPGADALGYFVSPLWGFPLGQAGAVPSSQLLSIHVHFLKLKT